MKLRAVLLFLLSLRFTSVVFAHGDHDHGLIQDEKLFADYLETVFAQVESDPSSIDRDDRFAVFDEAGKPFYLSRTKLLQSMHNAFSIFEGQHVHHCSGCSHEEKQSFLRGFLKGAFVRLKGLASPVTMALNEMGAFYRDPATRAKVYRDFLTVKNVRVRGYASGLMNEFGIVPMAVIIGAVGITWPPYSVVTEGIESVVVGPAHVWCLFFQYVYYKGFKWFLGNMRSVQIILEQGFRKQHESSLFRRLKMAFSSKLLERRLAAQLRQVLLEEPTQLVSKQQALKKMVNAGAPLYDFSASRVLWAGGYVSRNHKSEGSSLVIPSLASLLATGTAAQKVEYFLSALEALDLLATTVERRWEETIEDEGANNPELRDSYVEAAKILGAVRKQILKLRSNTQILAQKELSSEASTSEADKFDQTYQALTFTLGDINAGLDAPLKLEAARLRLGMKKITYRSETLDTAAATACHHAFMGL